MATGINKYDSVSSLEDTISDFTGQSLSLKVTVTFILRDETIVIFGL